MAEVGRLDMATAARSLLERLPARVFADPRHTWVWSNKCICFRAGISDPSRLWDAFDAFGEPLRIHSDHNSV